MAYNWKKKLLALITIANFLLVMFNLSYIPLRDIYYHYIPEITHIYDPIKAIEPHPDTQRYLNSWKTFETEVKQVGLEANTSQLALDNLRIQSKYLLTENPFLVANKLASLATLKRRMQSHLNTLSAQEAFDKFWSMEYWQGVDVNEEIVFFDSKITPLLAVNYYRHTDENGQFIDLFWLIDIYFVIFFAIEILVRTFWISRQREGLNWWDVILRRWYEWLLVLPTWRWLRIIPVTVRLHKSGLVNTERILAQVTHEPAAYLADKVALFLMVRLINQTQEAVETGEMARLLLEEGDYVEVSEGNKLDAIINHILDVSIYKVLPQVQPEVEALLHHSLRGAFKESNLYQSLQQVPALKAIPADVIENLADYLAQAAYEVLVNSYSDIKGRELFDSLADNFKQNLRRELQERENQAQLQSLLSDLLEELKINYVHGTTELDPEKTLTEAERIRQESKS